MSAWREGHRKTDVEEERPLSPLFVFCSWGCPGGVSTRIATFWGRAGAAADRGTTPGRGREDPESDSGGGSFSHPRPPSGEN